MSLDLEDRQASSTAGKSCRLTGTIRRRSVERVSSARDASGISTVLPGQSPDTVRDTFRYRCASECERSSNTPLISKGPQMDGGDGGVVSEGGGLASWPGE